MKIPRYTRWLAVGQWCCPTVSKQHRTRYFVEKAEQTVANPSIEATEKRFTANSFATVFVAYTIAPYFHLGIPVAVIK
jgi:hypothetical protein